MKNLKRIDEFFFNKAKISTPPKELNKEEAPLNKQEEPKASKPKDGYDLERFYSTVSKLNDKNQQTRKKKITNMFFRDFIGKPLMGSEIKEITTDVITGHSYYAISINLENGTKISYGFDKNDESLESFVINPFINLSNISREVDNFPYPEKPAKYKELKSKALDDGKKVSRTDVRMLGKIAKKCNPDTKYIKGTNDFVIKEYESKRNIIKFNEFRI